MFMASINVHVYEYAFGDSPQHALHNLFQGSEDAEALKDMVEYIKFFEVTPRGDITAEFGPRVVICEG